MNATVVYSRTSETALPLKVHSRNHMKEGGAGPLFFVRLRMRRTVQAGSKGDQNETCENDATTDRGIHRRTGHAGSWRLRQFNVGVDCPILFEASDQAARDVDLAPYRMKVLRDGRPLGRW